MKKNKKWEKVNWQLKPSVIAKKIGVTTDAVYYQMKKRNIKRRGEYSCNAEIKTINTKKGKKVIVQTKFGEKTTKEFFLKEHDEDTLKILCNLQERLFRIIFTSRRKNYEKN